MDLTFFLAVGVVIVLAFTAGYLIWMLAKYASNRNPSAKTIQAELMTMREANKEQEEKLIPWTKEEWELLSAHLGKNVEKKGMIKTATGLLHSIYHEPLASYQYKEYAGGTHSLLRIQTKNEEFVYWKKGKRIEIFKDGQAFGIIDESGTLRNKNGKKVVGRLTSGNQRQWLQVQLHEKEVAQLSTATDDQANPRAFDYVRELVPEDEIKLKALALSYVTLRKISFARPYQEAK